MQCVDHPRIVGWVERSETHRNNLIGSHGGFRFRSTHPTVLYTLYFCATDVPLLERLQT